MVEVTLPVAIDEYSDRMPLVFTLEVNSWVAVFDVPGAGVVGDGLGAELALVLRHLVLVLGHLRPGWPRSGPAAGTACSRPALTWPVRAWIWAWAAFSLAVMAAAWAWASEIWSAEAGVAVVTTTEVAPRAEATAIVAKTRLRVLLRRAGQAPGSTVEYCSA